MTVLISAPWYRRLESFKRKSVLQHKAFPFRMKCPIFGLQKHIAISIASAIDLCIMLIGYARISTIEQDTRAQVTALQSAGCELVFREKASGGRWDRPELHKLLSQLRKGDVLVVWKLDRLSRSLRDVLTIMERVQERKAGFRSLTEAVDTTTPAGRMMMQMVGAFAEFERAMLKERTKAGLDAARKEGRIGGRRPKLKPQQQQEIVKLVKRGKKTAADAARLVGVHPATVSRLLQRT